LDAFRAEGIKVGLYYSLLDWHHPDYPHCSDSIHPMRENPDYPDDGRNFDNYIEYFHGQVKELLTNYGKLDIMWFDFSYGEMTGEKWQATKLMEMVRSLQPWLITDNRLEGAGEEQGSIVTDNPTIYSGDFACPEQMIPEKGVTDLHGNSIPWESCITLNDHWGYCSADHHYKSPKMVVRNLVECVSKNGNMLLNVGPNAKGEIPEESVAILKEVGRWMKENSDSIYGCGISDMKKPDWGRFTQKGKKLYAHVMEEWVSPIALDILPSQVEKVRLLRDGSEIKLMVPWNATTVKDKSFFTFGGQTFPLPDELDTVVEITLK
ncbi:MAG TPA: alpha-L-fucosidase, partial [Candidatus Merdivicinus intestinavium]|nr:alpha-L-fucosidase [Candidatus Merdivicinus intestinavium]